MGQLYVQSEYNGMDLFYGRTIGGHFILLTRIDTGDMRKENYSHVETGDTIESP